MRYAVSLAALLICLLAVSAFADEGRVSRSTLDAVGLGGMVTMSDAEGHHVRGSGGVAATAGLSIVSGMLIDPGTKSYVWGTDTNSAATGLELAYLARMDPFHIQASTISLGLTVTSSNGMFEGVLLVAAGGTATALLQ